MMLSKLHGSNIEGLPSSTRGQYLLPKKPNPWTISCCVSVLAQNEESAACLKALEIKYIATFIFKNIPLVKSIVYILKEKITMEPISTTIKMKYYGLNYPVLFNFFEGSI